MLDKKNIIIGYSGHAYVVAESFISKGNTVSYYTDLNEASNNPFNLIYLGFESNSNFICKYARDTIGNQKVIRSVDFVQVFLGLLNDKDVNQSTLKIFADLVDLNKDGYALME